MSEHISYAMRNAEAVNSLIYFNTLSPPDRLAIRIADTAGLFLIWATDRHCLVLYRRQLLARRVFGDVPAQSTAAVHRAVLPGVHVSHLHDD
jgi:hypothetical protein